LRYRKGGRLKEKGQRKKDKGKGIKQLPARGDGDHCAESEVPSPKFNAESDWFAKCWGQIESQIKQ
jgi:hypothetical protein